jgi:hypothetical protein
VVTVVQAVAEPVVEPRLETGLQVKEITELQELTLPTSGLVVLEVELAVSPPRLILELLQEPAEVQVPQSLGLLPLQLRLAP